MQSNKVSWWAGKIPRHAPGALFACIGICLIAIVCAANAEQSPSLLVKKIDYSATPASAESKRGEKLFNELTCANCHSRDGRGGALGPPLDAIGAVRDEQYLLARLTDGRKKELDRLHGVTELMPHPRLPDDKARTIVKYLLTLPAPVDGFEIIPHRIPAHQNQNVQRVPGWQPSPPSLKSRQGLRLFADNGCFSCHSARGGGGWFGPALDGIGARRSPEYIASQVQNPELNISKTRKDHDERPSMMPKINLPKHEVDKIVAFLLTLPQRKKGADH